MLISRRSILAGLPLLAGGIYGPAIAQEQQPLEAPAFESKAPYAILIDARSGAVFYEKSADLSVPPASMSKLMTQSIIFDALKNGDLKPDQLLPVSEYAWRKGGAPSGGSTMYAELKSQVPVMDLLRGAIIQSANDGCITLAEGLAGSEQGFVALMTRRAKELGLTNSTFGNVTGLPDPVQRMSMRDLAVVARYIYTTHPDYFKIYSEREFTWNKIKQQNRNPLLLEYPGADGMKTGYTKEAGYGLVGTAERDGRRLIMVVGGVESIALRREESQKLLDFGFSQFRPFDVYDSGQQIGTARVWGGVERWVGLVTDREFKIALSPAEQKTAEIKLDYKGPLMAPVKQGSEIGKVRILIDGKTVADTPVFAASDVAATKSMWTKALDSVLIMTFGG
jgi:serine-type D-Ala-D-Ala carboxypeptidase (penicillin-binding protein 5/6)